MTKIPVICVVGPTACGKTAYAIALAQAVHGEIISMDSMQVYRHLDIGTAKPTLAERQGVPHHLIDVAEPSETFTVAQYADLAQKAIADCAARGRQPILAGGTGFYLRAITDGLHLGNVQSDPALREKLKQQAQTPEGRLELYAQLTTLDPATAARLHPNDVQRVSRALEVLILTGTPLSQQRREAEESPYRYCMIGLTMERSALYERIHQRVDGMLAAGLLDEVRGLLARGIPPSAQAMQGIGYKELTPVLQMGVPLAQAVTLLKQNTRHYAKRQWTWFRADERIQWLDVLQPGSLQQAVKLGMAFGEENAI